MAFVVGINLAVAFRMLGMVPGVATGPLSRFYTLHWYGALVIFLSGIALLIAYPAKALTNPVFYLKFSALSLGLVLAYRVQRILVIQAVPESERRLKWIAAASIPLWIITITSGRFLAYTHSVLLASRFY
ncbi:MAG: hypothetical protein QGG54_05930 [Gammaproteobacteria bacterium]|jgi:hypothetical protein|nr:hypothetical protein [Gammaproteobacteria bacterium]MDP6535731.1 hypothetical protein [Gammaproteobacteria bacterium]MDP6733213.1 hypothetical protein [Gammaproteobacteria bacterium]HAJ77312.1 hypothetical protein [Gammaproteobacteria bacterium]|tara:strand:- start:12 stop:401 length:390 start_codon:yes stop_codon:yes gene_type:complete